MLRICERFCIYSGMKLASATVQIGNNINNNSQDININDTKSIDDDT